MYPTFDTNELGISDVLARIFATRTNRTPQDRAFWFEYQVDETCRDIMREANKLYKDFQYVRNYNKR